MRRDVSKTSVAHPFSKAGHSNFQILNTRFACNNDSQSTATYLPGQYFAARRTEGTSDGARYMFIRSGRRVTG
jgi:hypothetical protein